MKTIKVIKIICVCVKRPVFLPYIAQIRTPCDLSSSPTCCRTEFYCLNYNSLWPIMHSSRTFNVFSDLISDASNWLVMKVKLVSTSNCGFVASAAIEWDHSQENEINLIPLIDYSDNIVSMSVFKWWMFISQLHPHQQSAGK